MTKGLSRHFHLGREVELTGTCKLQCLGCNESSDRLPEDLGGGTHRPSWCEAKTNCSKQNLHEPSQERRSNALGLSEPSVELNRPVNVLFILLEANMGRGPLYRIIVLLGSTTRLTRS